MIDLNLAERQDAPRLTPVRHLHAVDPMDGFREEAFRHGLNIPSVIANGRLQRFPSDPQKPRDLAGWYVYHGDGIPSAAFGCWRSGINETWCSVSDRDMTTIQRNEHRRRVDLAKEKARVEQEAERSKCREESARLWEKSPVAAPDHPYLLKKLIGTHNLRQNGDDLIAPVRTVDGVLHGLQKIDPSGEKRFTPGTAKRSAFHMIGDPTKSDRILIAEGLATAASLHESTKLPTVIAFDCGNLGPVATAIKTAYPTHRIALCCDDDHLTPGNPGRTSAEEAARAIGGTVAIPSFPSNRGEKDTDFNDLFRVVGTEEVKRQVEAALAVGTAAAPIPVEPKTKALFATYEALVANAPPLSWFAKKRIERETLGMIVAASGAGKSFAVIDLALAAIFKKTWAGVPVACDGIIVIIAGEGKSGLLRRVRAYEKHHGVKVGGRLLISNQRIEISRASERAIEEELAAASEAAGLPIDLIIVDTLARALPEGADENKAVDVGPLINALDRIRDRFRAVGILVHHTGVEGNRSRGTTSLPAACDFILSVQKSGSVRTLDYVKMKDGELPPSVDFTLTHVPLGVDDDGDVYGSAVVEWQGVSRVEKPKVTLTRYQLVGIDSLRLALADFGRPVSIDEWRPRFYQKHTGGDHAKVVAFSSVRATLVERGFISYDGSVYSIPTVNLTQ